MFDADNRHKQARGRSLLSHEAPARRAPSLLSAAEQPEDDPVARYRLARSRRVAAPNPLLSALAREDGRQPAPGNLTDGVDEGVAETGVQVPGGRLRDIFADGLRRLRRGAAEGYSAEAPVEPADRSVDEPARPPLARAAAPLGEPGGDKGRRAADAADIYWRPLIDPMKVILGVVNSKALIALATLVGALIGVAIALSTPKMYESYAELLVDPRDLQLTDRNLTPDVLPSDATLAIVENQVRVIMSSSVLSKVVDQLNLASDPEFNGEGSGGFSLRGLISDLRSLLSREDASSGDDRRRVLAIGNLAEQLMVERGGKTFVIVIGVKTRSADKSALIANTMTEAFLQAYGRIQSDTAGRAADELTSKLDELRKGVEEAERKIAAFKAEHDIIDAQGKLITDEEILRLNDQLSAAKARTLELNARAASSKDIDVGTAVGGGLPEELTSATLTELRGQYATMKQEVDRLDVQLGPRHPQRMAAAAQLQGARNQIASELRRIVESIQVDLRRAVQLEQELSARLAQLKVRQGGLNDELVTLRELERESTAKRAVYEAYLLRARETTEQRDMNTANISVISEAYPPLDPVGPSRAAIAMAGTVFGFMAGIGLGAARGAWQSLREGGKGRRRGRTTPQRAAFAATQARGGPDRGPDRAGPAPSPDLPDGPASPPAGPGLLERVRAAPERLRRSAIRDDQRQPAPRERVPETRTAEPPRYDASPAQPQPAAIQPPGVQPVYTQPVPQQVYQQPAHPAYAQPVYAPPQVYAQPQPYFQPAFVQPPQQAMAYPYAPYPQVQQGYPYAAAIQPAPQFYAPAYPGMVEPQRLEPVPASPMEEIRDELREFREAVRELSADRARRRFY